MATITDPAAVRELYAELGERRVSMPCFCTENLRTIEAVLTGVNEVAAELGVDDLPVCIAFTVTYPGRPQAVHWTSLEDPLLGALLCLDTLNTLAASDGPFDGLRVLTLLDHGQPESDRFLLEECIRQFSCVMFDGSMFPFDENIRRTAEYVERYKNQVTIEGAVDEIAAQGSGKENALCTVERAKRFVAETGVDIIVPNVGTEHRDTGEKARYHGDLARSISEAVGPMLCLHGTSSLGATDIDRLKDDGIIKVNIWTRLERIGGQAVARQVLQELGHILPESEIASLVAEGVLGPAFQDAGALQKRYGDLGPRLESIAEIARRKAWVDAVVPVVKEYLYAFGYDRFAK